MLLCAAHATRYVELPGYKQRGGIFLVAEPANLKSTMIDVAIGKSHDALVLSDMNAQMLNQIKPELEKEVFTTLGFGEFEKLYERNPATAKNLEGTIRAMIEEGFGNPSFMSPLQGETLARVLLFGGITRKVYDRRFTAWSDSGFARRILWIKYKLQDARAVGNAIESGKRIPFPDFTARFEKAKRGVPTKISKEAKRRIRKMLRAQSEETPYILLLKIYCVLAQSEGVKEALRILEDCSDCFLRNGGELILCDGKSTSRKRKSNRRD